MYHSNGETLFEEPAASLPSSPKGGLGPRVASQPNLDAYAQMSANTSVKRAPAAIVHVPTASTKGRSYSSLVSTSAADKTPATPLSPEHTAPNGDYSRTQVVGGSASNSRKGSTEASPSEAGFVPKRNGSGSKMVDASKPLHKNTPAPCNRFYLTDAGCVGTCNFSHEYKLTTIQLATV